MRDQQVGTVVIGGSQAGLAVGYHLKLRGLPFVILDDNERIGDVRTAVKVDRLSKVGDRFEVICGKDTLLAGNAVVATGASSNARIPAFARELDPRWLDRNI